MGPPTRDHTEYDKARAISKKIKTQFVGGHHSRLMHAVVESALLDSVSVTENSKTVDSSRVYLAGDIVHAELCDVDPDWVRLLIKMVGLSWYRERTRPVDGKPNIEIRLYNGWHRPPFDYDCRVVSQ